MGLEFVAFYFISLMLVQHEFEARLEEASKRPPCIVTYGDPEVYVKPYQVELTPKGKVKRECVKWRVKPPK